MQGAGSPPAAAKAATLPQACLASSRSASPLPKASLPTQLTGHAPLRLDAGRLLVPSAGEEVEGEEGGSTSHARPEPERPEISSIADDAFGPFGCRLRRLSLSGNPLGSLPPHVFDPLGCLELLDLGRAQLRGVEEDAFRRSVPPADLVAEPKSVDRAARRTASPHACLGPAAVGSWEAREMDKAVFCSRDTS